MVSHSIAHFLLFGPKEKNFLSAHLNHSTTTCVAYGHRTSSTDPTRHPDGEESWSQSKYQSFNVVYLLCCLSFLNLVRLP
ncbi:hypothetical protein ACFX15_007994 [Malus domestica]